jgi:hypothetical protein
MFDVVKFCIKYVEIFYPPLWSIKPISFIEHAVANTVDAMGWNYEERQISFNVYNFNVV